MSRKKKIKWKVGQVKVVKIKGRKYYKKKLSKGRFRMRLVHPKTNPNPKKGSQKSIPRGHSKARHFNYNGPYIRDKKQFNKREGYEIPFSKRKSGFMGKGKGWWGEKLRHSLARKLGKAPKILR